MTEKSTSDCKYCKLRAYQRQREKGFNAMESMEIVDDVNKIVSGINERVQHME